MAEAGFWLRGMWLRLFGAVFCVLLGLSAVGQAGTINVPGNYGSVQAAIDAALAGDLVLVGAGTYNETIDLLGKAITVESVDGAGVTILDAGGSGSVVVCASGETAGTVIRGFTLRGGNAAKGGGLFCNSTAPTVSHCIFTGNSATDGGAVYSKGNNPTFINCLLYNNTASGSGGAIYNFNSDPVLTNCTLTLNSAADGAIYNNNGSTPTIVNSILWGDTPSEFSGTGAPAISFSDVQGGALNVDPLFVNGASDFRLQAVSTLIGQGNNSALNLPSEDLDGQQRVLGGVVEIGAYEYFDDCDGDNIPDELEADTDGDGLIDDCDSCPNDAANDADGDGVCGDVDLCPGFDDNLDVDSDGIPNDCDSCPNDAANDADGDGVCGDVDVCPGFDDALDADGDTIPDDCDVCAGWDDRIDGDGDGVPDDCDICLGHDDSVDTDGDGVPNGCDICSGSNDNTDTDGDTVPDGCDICPGFDDLIDSDGDTIPEGCDVCPGGDDRLDSDGDGVPNDCDVCVGFDDAIDTDGDGMADGCDACPNDPANDADGDGVCGDVDLCPGNNDNIDTDSDGIPNGCDACPNDSANDADGDGVCGDVDQCPGFDDTLDADSDGIADGCDVCPNDSGNDADGDGVCGDVDVCPGFDDAIDSDGDGIPNGCDTPSVHNITQGNSYFSIQEAIDAAVNGEEIVLDPGRYSGAGNHNIYFNGKAITVRSTDPLDFDIVATTMVDPNYFEYNAKGFHFVNGEGPNSILEGITIRGCHGPAILCDHASPTIRNCIIKENLSNSDSWAVIECGYSSVVISNCIVTHNGGQVSQDGRVPVVPVYLWSLNVDEHPQLINCVISANETSSAYGAGVLCLYVEATIRNCVIVGNHAKNTFNGQVTFPGSFGAGVFAASSQLNIENSILRGDISGQGAGIAIADVIDSPFEPSRVVVSYSNIQGGANDVLIIPDWNAYVYDGVLDLGLINPNTLVWGEGNIDQDALFVQDPNEGGDGWWDDPVTVGFDEGSNNDYGDFHLQAGSPSINAGDPNAAFVAADIDLDGQARVIYERVDMGVDEFAFVGDFDLSGLVDGVDLSVLADQWLLGLLTYDVADGRDGVVDLFDFVALQKNAWAAGQSFDLGGFVGEWLGVGAVSDDLAPEGGDGVFDLYDYSALAANWMAGI